MLQFRHNPPCSAPAIGIPLLPHLRTFLIVTIVLSVAGLSALRGDAIAFFYALDSDLDALKDGDSTGLRSMKVVGSNIQEFQVGPHKVRAVRMGAGNVETAVNAANLLGKFPADLAISVGPCGALSGDLHQGSWYQVSSVVGYQRGTFTPSGWSQSDEAVLPLPPLAAATPAAGDAESIPALPAIKLASGDVFVANDAERVRVRAISNADGVDMNSYGLLLVCQKAKVPLLIWKVVSDDANSSAPEDFKVFVKSYQGQGGRMAREYLLKRKSSPLSLESYGNIRELMQ